MMTTDFSHTTTLFQDDDYRRLDARARRTAQAAAASTSSNITDALGRKFDRKHKDHTIARQRFFRRLGRVHDFTSWSAVGEACDRFESDPGRPRHTGRSDWCARLWSLH